MTTKKNELVGTTKPWTYEDAVRVGKELVRQHQKLSLDLVRELYSAREALSSPGFRQDLVSNETRLNSFQNYLDDIGMSKATAHRWLALYDSEHDKLLSPEEFKAMKIVEFESLIKQLRPDYPDWRPDGWSPACETYYRKKLQEQQMHAFIGSKEADQLDLFDETFYATITAPIATPADILHFSELKRRIAPVAFPGASIDKQARAVMIIEKVLQGFPKKDKSDIAKAMANATLLLAAEED